MVPGALPIETQVFPVVGAHGDGMVSISKVEFSEKIPLLNQRTDSPPVLQFERGASTKKLSSFRLRINQIEPSSLGTEKMGDIK